MSTGTEFAERERPFPLLEEVSVAAPWFSYLVRLRRFPLPADMRPRLREVVAVLVQALRDDAGLQRSVFLLLDTLHHEDAVTAISRHAAVWQPEMGMGVRPEEPSPKYWNGDELLDRDYSEEMPPMKQTVVALETDEAGAELACEVMTGRGGLIQVLHRGDAAALTEAWYTTLQPTILEEGLAAYPLYVPVLSTASLSGQSAEVLDRWMGRADVYVRESAEDEAVLVLSRWPVALPAELERSLVELGAVAGTFISE